MTTENNDQHSTWHPPDNSFVKHLIHQGQGHEYPVDGTTCIVTMNLLNVEELAQFSVGDEFWGYPLQEKQEMKIGEGDTEMASVIDKCLKSMKQGEICELSCLAYAPKKNAGSDKLSLSLTCANHESTANFITEVNCVPVEIKLRLELTSVEENTPLWDLSSTGKLARALHHKSKGTEFFKMGNVEFAFRRYRKSLKILLCMLPESSIPEEVLTEYSEMRCHCYLNLAACQLKTQKWDFVLMNCSKALEIQPKNVKALYRRGLARKSLKQFKEAFADLTKCLETEPNNRTASKALREIETEWKEQNSRMAAGFNKMFAS